MDSNKREDVVHSMGMKYEEAVELFSDETLDSMSMSHVVGGADTYGQCPSAGGTCQTYCPSGCQNCGSSGGSNTGNSGGSTSSSGGSTGSSGGNTGSSGSNTGTGNGNASGNGNGSGSGNKTQSGICIG